MIGRRDPCDSGVIASTPVAGGCPGRSKPWVLAATILGSSMAFIDGAAVGVALPVMQIELAASIVTMQWVVNAYSLFLAALILIGGSGGDRFGRRRTFVIGIAVFAAASIACGLATSAVGLVVARGAQGIGGALMIPNSLAIIGATFDAGERGRAIGTWAGFSAIAGALGPVLGGWLVDAISWRAIFFINVPLALITVFVAVRHMPESHDHGATSKLDWRGAVLAAAALGLGAFGLMQSSVLGWQHPAVFGSLLAAALLLVAFVWAEARHQAPMMPLGLFRSRTFSGVNLLTLLLYGALGGAFFFLPFDLIQVQGYPAMLAGAAFLPFTLVMGVLSRWSGGLLDRFGARRPLIIGPIVAAMGFALLAWAGIGGSYWSNFFPPMAILGLGMAISVAPLTTTVMNAVTQDRAGVASGINNAVAEVATLFAVAVFGVVGLAVFNHVLVGHLSNLNLPPDVTPAVDAIGKALTGATLPDVVQGDYREVLKSVVDSAFVSSFRLLMLIAAALALLGSLCAALTIESPRESSGVPMKTPNRIVR